MTDPNRPLRIGIVGANWSLKVHGTAWRMLPGIEVGAVCTAHRETAEAAAQMFGVPKAYWNVEEMCADPTLETRRKRYGKFMTWARSANARCQAAPATNCVRL